MSIFEGCTTKDGDFVGPDDCHWDDRLQYVLCDVLGFCGCGMNEAAARWVVDGLSLIAEMHQRTEESWRRDYADWSDRVNSLYGANDGARYFFWYWCNDKGLTEHGGSVPGWLEPKGQEVLDVLKEELAKLDREKA